MIQKPIDVLLTGVWITTGGTMYNDMARYIGEARHCHTCMQQSGTTCQKPILLGFANLTDVRNYKDIKQKSRSWPTPTPNPDVTDEQVRGHSLDRVYC